MSLLSAASSVLFGDSLQKLRITYEKYLEGDYAGSFEALFNPAQLRFSKEVSWEIEPVQGVLSEYHRFHFLQTKPKTLSVELFFDTYEGAPATGVLGALARSATTELAALNPLGGASGVDVSTYTKQVSKLGRRSIELHRPPRCKLYWGKNLLIHGVLTSLSEDFTFFLPNGTPVRAVLACTFTEALDVGAPALDELHSSDVDKKWTIKTGDTLSSIAEASYGDARLWRVIARANGIDDPRRLTVGRLLAIPKLGADG